MPVHMSMKKRQGGTPRTCHLPDDVLRQIFTKCAVDTKVQLRTVCKTFNMVVNTMQKNVKIQLTRECCTDLTQFVSMRRLIVQADRSTLCRLCDITAHVSKGLRLDIRALDANVSTGELLRLLSRTTWCHMVTRVNLNVQGLLYDHPFNVNVLTCENIALQPDVCVRPSREPITHLKFAAIETLNLSGGDGRLLPDVLGNGTLFPALLNLSIQDFVVLDGKCFKSHRCLRKLGLNECILGTDVVFYMQSRTLRELAICACEIHETIDLTGVPQLRNLHVDNDEMCWVDYATPNRLAKICLRTVWVDVAEATSWTTVRRVELVDCAYNQDLSDIYEAVLRHHNSTQCLMGFTPDGCDDEVEKRHQALEWWCDQHASLTLDHQIHVTTCVGSAAFNDVKGLLFRNVEDL